MRSKIAETQNLCSGWFTDSLMIFCHGKSKFILVKYLQKSSKFHSGHPYTLFQISPVH